MALRADRILVLTAAGVFALLRLPVALFPTIAFPRIAVTVDAGDRPADQMVVQVTRPAEEALRAIPGVRNIRSQTSRGSTEISVTFHWGQDMTTAALQAESELAQLASCLPRDLRSRSGAWIQPSFPSLATR